MIVSYLTVIVGGSKMEGCVPIVLGQVDVDRQAKAAADEIVVATAGSKMQNRGTPVVDDIEVGAFAEKEIHNLKY